MTQRGEILCILLMSILGYHVLFHVEADPGFLNSYFDARGGGGG